MCRIMIANTLSTNYRSFFNWDEQTYAYFTIEKMGSERYHNINVYWDQSTGLQRDEWDVWFLNNTSY